MTAWFAVALVLAAGWGVSRRLAGRHDPAGTLVSSTVAGLVVALLWMAVLDLAGIAWSAASLGLVVVPALLAGVTARRARARSGPWHPWGMAAVAAVLARIAATSSTPAFGWDFRYIWGLKARVFALAGAHDLGWLAWPGNASFAHPAYPPLWSDLVAFGVAFGADAGSVAAVWQAVLAAGLAAACWRLAAGAPPWVRALAATAAAWSPVLADPLASGYAEPLLAFLTAVGLGAVCRPSPDGAGGWWLLPATTALLVATKNEGAALALGLVVAAVVATGVRHSAPAAAAAGLAWMAWHAALPAAMARSLDFAPSWAGAVTHAVALPAALAAAIGRAPTIALMLAGWVVCLLAWWGRELRPARLACAVWALAVIGAYLSTAADLTWHLATSAERVLAVPLPAVLALAVSARFSADQRVGARRAPGTSHDG